MCRRTINARVVFDPVGGPSFGPLTQSMSRGGTLLAYGALSSEPTPFPLLTVLSKSLCSLFGALPEFFCGWAEFSFWCGDAD